MLTLAKIGRGSEDYHLRSVGADATQYFSERGEVAGRWLGGGAAELGLAGRVQDEALLSVLAGYEPGAEQRGDEWVGRRLVAPPSDGSRMPGIDACFKAPKSVTLLWAFGDTIAVGDRTLDGVVQAAHDEAVHEAMTYLESVAAKGRRGHDGIVQMDSRGFVAAAFRHRTSRANDPHLHTHVLIANMCRGKDGRWGALDARLLFAHAKAAGYLYESHLRYRLSRDLGVDWKDVENGIADVSGVPEEMISLFSKRSKEMAGRLDEVAGRINAERMRLGLAPVEARSAKALDIAARATRAAKIHHLATSTLRADWRRQAEAGSFDVGSLADILNLGRPAPSTEVDADLHRRVTAGLTEDASTFGRRDTVQAMAADAGSGLPVAKVLERVEALLASRDVIPVVGRRGQDVIQRSDGAVVSVPTDERRWSTPEMLSVEMCLVASALRRQGVGVAVVPDSVLKASLRDSLGRLPSLAREQVVMAVRLARSGNGVECVEAGPGTGKTTALGVYVAACRRAGIRVIGCAPSAQARDQLRLGARIDPCHTVDRLLWELRRSPLAAGSVVILDEASMAGSRKLSRLLAYAEAANVKVVLVGDTRQLSSVDAGGGFRGLVARLGAHHLRENRRQVHQWERDALRELRDGDVRSALTAYATHGRLRVGDRDELLQSMVADWWAAQDEGEAVMQASNWRDVVELNALARGRLVKIGAVERDGLDVRGETVGVGDQVIVLRNNRRRGVINGTLGTVIAIDHKSHDIHIRTMEAEPQLVRLPARFWDAKGRRRLALAYCRTIHKSQGSTYRGKSFTLAGDDTVHLEAVHVALSRATEANYLYYMGEPPPDEDHHLTEGGREPGLASLVAAASRPGSQVMALDLLQGLAEWASGGKRPPEDDVQTDAPELRVADVGPGEKPHRYLATADAPMTEAQATVLARKGVVPPGDLTWVQASLLIDSANNAPRGARAAAWLREHGASPDEAAKIIERAERELRADAWARAPMTEAQVAILARHGVAYPGRNLSWVQASLLIDREMGNPCGKAAMSWLREGGASADKAAAIIERAERELLAPGDGRLPSAVTSRLEVLEGCVGVGRGASEHMQRERQQLEQWDADATCARRRARARRAPIDAQRHLRDVAVTAASRAGSARASPRVAR